MSVNKVNKTTGDLSLLAGGTLYADSPIGSIIPYGGATAPAGWFICDGTELVRATYPELFAVIGTSFGTPSDNTKFKLPDLREATTKGVGLTGKSNNHYDADGLALGEFIDDRMQDWRGTGKWRMFIPNDSEGWNFITQSSNGDEISGRYGATTEVKAVGVNYIIKAVSVGVPADFMSAVNNLRTTTVAEPTALSNIGTSANATQHEVNAAVDDTFSLLKVITKKGFSVPVPAETSTNNSWLVTVHSKELQNNSLGAAFVVRNGNTLYVSNITITGVVTFIPIQEDGDNAGQIKTSYTGLNYDHLMNWNFKPMGKFQF